jgi:hypothetical protein
MHLDQDVRDSRPLLQAPLDPLSPSDDSLADSFDSTLASSANSYSDFQRYSIIHNLNYHQDPTFAYNDIPPESVKLLLPEVCHPHSQERCTVFGIPFPSSIRNTFVPPRSEIDAWNNYYFAEDPDVRPYVAGLTCVPDVDLLMPY